MGDATMDRLREQGMIDITPSRILILDEARCGVLPAVKRRPRRKGDERDGPAATTPARSYLAARSADRGEGGKG